MNLHIREPINSLSHLLGIILSCIGLVLLLYVSILSGNTVKIVSSLVFSFGLIALYTASTVYHWKITSEKTLEYLRKVDHIMIYILIAATYTPICLVTLKGFVGYLLLAIIWSLAIAGMILKLFWLNGPRWLYTSFYLILGWAAIFVIYPLYKALPLMGLIMLISGGLYYSIGAVVYATKSDKIRLWKFGFHEIFHVFILLGSISHFLLIYNYVVS